MSESQQSKLPVRPPPRPLASQLVGEPIWGAGVATARRGKARRVAAENFMAVLVGMLSEELE